MGRENCKHPAVTPRGSLMRRQSLPRLLLSSRTSRAHLAPHKPGNYTLCRGCALSTALAPGMVLAGLQLRWREQVPGPLDSAWLRSQVVGVKARVDEVSRILPSPQHSERSPHSSQTLPPEHEPGLPQRWVPLWDLHSAEIGPSDLPVHRQRQG